MQSTRPGVRLSPREGSPIVVCRLLLLQMQCSHADSIGGAAIFSGGNQICARANPRRPLLSASHDAQVGCGDFFFLVFL